MSNKNQSTTLSKNKISMQNNDLGNEFREQMYKYFEKQTLCDIIIKAGQSTSDNEICAHRLVLSSQSQYFHNIFIGGTWDTTNQTEIVIQNITEELLKKIIEYCYTGRLEIKNSKDQVDELLNKATYFEIKFLEETCIKWLISYSSLTTLAIYRLYSLEKYSAELNKKLFGDICENFMELYKSEEFLQLSADKLAKLLAQDNIRVQSEENVLEALLAWLNYKSDERQQHIDKLLPLIRIPFLKPAYIFNHLKSICESKDNMKLMMEALEWHNVPANRATLDWICTRQRNFLPMIMIIGNGQLTDAAKYFEVYDPTLNKSVHCDIMPKGRTYISGTAAAVMDGELIVAGGYEQERSDALNTVYKLNFASMTWSQLPSMLTARILFQLIVFHHKMYAVGGFPYTNTVECWDSTTNVWKFVSEMSAKRSNHSVIELDNKIYALCGDDGNNTLSSVECYEPNLNMWTTKASMNKQRSRAGVGILNDFLYVIGGAFCKDSKWSEVRSVERYDAKSDKWILLHTIDDKIRNLKCISLHNYFICTTTNNNSEEIIKYDPVTNEITTLHKLKYERWCHEVLVIPPVMLSKFQ